MTGKKQNMALMWKKLMKHVDIDEPTSFLDHVHLGCTQRECKPTETIIEQCTMMSESRICVGARAKYHGRRNFMHGQRRGPVIWKDMLKNVLNDTANSRTKKMSNFFKEFRILVWTVINSNRRNLKQLENCQKFARKLF